MLKKFNIKNNVLVDTKDNLGELMIFSDPTPEEKKYLTNTFQLDAHTLNSALDPEELSRLEFEPEHIALIFKRPRNFSGKDQLLFKVASMGMFLFKDRLVVVISEDIPLLTGKRFGVVQSLKDVFLKIIYNSISHYIEHLKVINMISDEIEKKISTSLENKYLLNLFSLEKSLVYYSNAISSNGFVFEKLKNHSSRIGFDERLLEMLEDITVENSQCLRQTDIYSNILASLMDARASVVNNNLNMLMKTLNLIAICIMLPALVVSFFSMNVKIPFQGYPYAFWIIVGLAVVSIAVTVGVWYRKKW
ncbi:MAG TPA: magnesium transporter CorA family protein [Elusimicrobiales bacterium]|nr:magnesium transporter CorA family protein [Elusimicrobiales bacterium]